MKSINVSLPEEILAEVEEVATNQGISVSEAVRNLLIRQLKMDKRVGGIYAIRNITNNKRYVGSTNDFRNRWRQHSQDLRKGEHNNIKLQRAWNKYGETNFVFETLEICSSENDQEMLEKEYFWSNKFDVIKSGYNLETIDKAGRPVFTSKTKRKIADVVKNQWSQPGMREKMIQGMKAAAEKRSVKRIVLKFDLNGTFVEHYASPFEALNANGRPSSLYGALAANDKPGSSGTHAANGFIYRYATPEEITSLVH